MDGRGDSAHVPPVGVGSGAGGVVGSGAGAWVVVGGAGGGFGALVVRGGAEVRGGAALIVVLTGGAASVVEVGSSAGGASVVTFGFGGAALVGWGTVRLAREAGCGFRTGGAAFLTAGAFSTLATGVWAGVALAIAAASPPVAITAPAATPFVTSDSRRSARSREWWAGG